MQRRRKRRAGDDRPQWLAPGSRTKPRYLEPLLDRCLVGGPQALEQPPVGVAAPKEHVLAVVEVASFAGKAPRCAAEAGPGLENRDAVAGINELQGSRYPCQS